MNLCSWPYVRCVCPKMKSRLSSCVLCSVWPWPFLCQSVLQEASHLLTSSSEVQINFSEKWQTGDNYIINIVAICQYFVHRLSCHGSCRDNSFAIMSISREILLSPSQVVLLLFLLHKRRIEHAMLINTCSTGSLMNWNARGVPLSSATIGRVNYSRVTDWVK